MSDEFSTTLRLPRDMAKDIETYWHRAQLPNRNAAIRELLAYALDAKLAKPAKEQRRG